jgi:hypothetical protein
MNKHWIIYAVLFSVALILSIRVNYEKKKWFKEELKLYWGMYCYHLHHFITYSLFIGLILTRLIVTKNLLVFFNFLLCRLLRKHLKFI